MTHRIERDPLGDKPVPGDAYYGIQTARALENFPISGLRAHAELVTATVLIKKCAARANMALGRLAPDIGNAIVSAADEIIGGQLRDHFVVDVYQAGAGTSHNMNANEVLANRAAEMRQLDRQRILRVQVLAAATLEDQPNLDLDVAIPLLEMQNRRPGSQVVA